MNDNDQYKMTMAAPSYETRLFDEAVIRFTVARIPQYDWANFTDLLEWSRRLATQMMDARK
jgi:hypothetical protein